MQTVRNERVQKRGNVQFHAFEADISRPEEEVVPQKKK
jgi:hypothetical protein